MPLTVEQLIEKLSQLDPKAIVQNYYGSTGIYDVYRAESTIFLVNKEIVKP